MNIIEFVNLFDKEKIESAKVAFTFYSQKTCKWNFWCDEGTSKEELIEHLKQYPEFKEFEFDGFEEVSIEPWDEGSIRIRIHFD